MRSRRPLLIIDVDTGNNEKDRIEVFHGDEPAKLAAEFCEKHDYDEATQATLQKMIEDRLKKALIKLEQKRREKKRQLREVRMSQNTTN